ncbi:MAG: vacuolar-type H+-ATPase subunit H [Pleurocapsa sp.]
MVMLHPNSSYDYEPQPRTSDRKQVKGDNKPLDYNVQTALEQLEELILTGTHIPLTNLIVLDEELVFDTLDTIKQLLPSELAIAIEILKHQQDITSQAENYAREIVQSAQTEANKIIQESSIITKAELEAAKIELKIEQECERAREETQQEIQLWREEALAEIESLQRGADEYADRVLSNLEQQLLDMLTIIQQGRQQLDTGNSDCS